MRVKPSQLQPYIDAGVTLIPLFPHDAIVSRFGREEKAGKRPIHGSWTVRDYDSQATIALAETENNNVGVRLESSGLVLDIDPRNGGTEGLAALRADFPTLDEVLEFAPLVQTGGGGFHFYLRKPDDCKVVDTLEAYAGVEFKSKGRQVVAAGSIHPETHNYYRWDNNKKRVPLEDAPEIPGDLLNVIKRAPRAATLGDGGGEITPAYLEKMLSLLPADKYAANDRWLPIMMAAHHATAGEGRDVFIAWSISDPSYGDQADLIGRRWDSCHKERNDGYRFGTLRKEVYATGKAHKLPPMPNASDDFADDPNEFEPDDDDDGIEPAEAPAVLTAMNRDFMAVLEGGNFRIMRQVHDEGLNRTTWERIKLPDFNAYFANRRVEREEGKTIAASTAWMEWGGRRTYDRVTFDPDATEDKPGVLNLWTGWGVEPSPKGSWDLLQEMMRDCLCDGDPKMFEYVMNWCAYMFQHPGTPAESCIVFRGDQGIGKGTLGNALLKLCGRHGVHVQTPDHVTGRFNSHLRDCIFLFSDEAIKPYDKRAENKLKGLVTEPSVQIEGKGLDQVTVPNKIHVMMASNEEWVVPVGPFERRYVVSNANNKWLGKTAKWKALREELDNGGYRRMLFDLLRRPLGDFHPRMIVRNTALAEQHLHSMPPIQTFLFNAVHDGVWPGATVDPAANWSADPIQFPVDDAKAEFDMWAKAQGITPGNSGRANKAEFEKQILATLPGAKVVHRKVPDDVAPSIRRHSDGRLFCFELPPLSDCRAAFDALLKAPQAWRVVDEDEFEFG